MTRNFYYGGRAKFTDGIFLFLENIHVSKNWKSKNGNVKNIFVGRHTIHEIRKDIESFFYFKKIIQVYNNTVLYK
jgi:hypothetical protein